MKMFLSSLMLIVSLSAFAEDPYELKKLDVLNTCTLNSIKESNAELALSMTKAVFSWHVGDQYSMLAKDFVSWHSGLADLVVAFPSLKDKVPFPMGQFNTQSLVATMAFIANSNDPELYSAVIKRIDCVGNNKVVVIGDFKSAQVNRDANGCVTHKFPYTSSLRLVVETKQVVTNGVTDTVVSSFDTHIDENVNLRARDGLINQMKTQPPLKVDPSSCKTFKSFFDEFNAQISI